MVALVHVFSLILLGLEESLHLGFGVWSAERTFELVKMSSASGRHDLCHRDRSAARGSGRLGQSDRTIRAGLGGQMPSSLSLRDTFA